MSKSGILREAEFNLDNVRGYVKLTKSITTGPFQTMHTSGLTACSWHFKRVNVVVEPDPHREYDAVTLIHGYTILKPGSSRVSIGIHNISCRLVTIPAKTNFAIIAAANVVHHPHAPKVGSDEQVYQGCNNNLQNNTKEEFGGAQNIKVEKVLEPPVLTPERENLLFSKIDLEGIWDWSEELKVKTKDLFREYAHIFALESLEMGHMSLVKHKIKLDNYTPFEERYQQIPPTLFDEVKKHLKEMIQVGAIRHSERLWASAVVLVRKKDGSLCFCIDLRRLNAHTVKDTYSLPHIDETLDCLSGAIIFTSLDLKSGYWQVEMDKESKPLTAFTVGPLGFYECKRMPFRLTNAPTTFQCLMESCLGELHLNWCIIYLDDIIVFSKTPEEHLERLQGIFDKLATAGLKLKPSKCGFFKSKITYLGHIVSAAGIETDPKKIEAVKN